MVALDSYEILLKSNNREINIDVNQFSFRMKSSIWNVLPTGNLIIKDKSGQLQEFLLSIPGTPISISYGFVNDSKRVEQKYIIDYDLIDDLDNEALISGDVEAPLIHEWITKQKISTQGFNAPISNVIQDLVASDFRGDKLDIDSTQNDNTWYQMGRLQKDFIEEVLLPSAYSTQSKNTPFFCFIDNNNTFRFKNYNQLISSKPVAELSYRITTEESYDLNVLLDLARKRRKFTENLLDNETDSYIINTETGELEVSEDSILLYPPPTANQVIARRAFSEKTRIDFYDRDYDPDSIIGDRIFSKRKAISQDQFILIANFNPDLLAGKTVTLKNYYMNSNEKSPESVSQFAGNYLIEECEHIWDGISGGGALTRLLVSRKYTKLGNDYILKEELTK